MKNRIICLALLVVSLLTGKKLLAQCELYEKQGIMADTSYQIRFSGSEGYIFPDNYHGHVADTSVVTFRLTHKQVARIEEILNARYNEAFKKDSRVSQRYKSVKDVKTYLKDFDRQYLGFIDGNNERCALLILANRKGKNRDYFPCFDRVMTIGTGDFFARNQRFFIVNLDKSILTLA